MKDVNRFQFCRQSNDADLIEGRRLALVLVTINFVLIASVVWSV